MKNLFTITFSIMLIACLGLQSRAQTGATCASPNVIAAIPYMLSDTTTAGSVSDYDETMACTSTFMGGEDYVFEFTPTADMNIQISLTNTSTGFLGGVGVFIIKGCPDDPAAECVDFDSGTPGTDLMIANAALDQDSTYYIIVSTDPGFIGTFTTTTFDIEIIEVFPFDAGITAITAPQSGCNLGATETVTVTIANFGFDSIWNFPVLYSLDGGVTEFVDNYTDTILPGATATFSFISATVDFSGFASYDISAYTTLVGDADATNDTATVSVVHSVSVSAFPFSEDFESDNGDFITGGTTSSWAYGIPGGTVINDSATMNHAWATNLTGNCNTNETSTLAASCFDFSSLTRPIISFDIWYETIGLGQGTATVQYSLDDGATWNTVVGEAGAQNWYTGTQGWSGSSGEWVTVSTTIDTLGLQSAVKLRINFAGGFLASEGVAIDNFMIYDSPANDMGAISISAPVSGCGLTNAEVLTVTFQNFGVDTIFGFDAVYSYSGGGSTETLTDTILPGETFTYDYVFPLDLSAINTTFTIQAWGVLTGDTIHNNDTTEVAVTNTQLVNSFPYLSDFESGTAGWTVTGTNPSWELGVANDSIINDTVTGNISWGTSLTGNYNTGETSFILGPCYDFTGLLLPIIGLDVWYETPTQGTARVQYSIDGGSTWVTITTGTIADNWYTGATGWSGSSGGWISAFTSVPALAGESDVRLRVRFAGGNSAGEGVAVDNITITDAPAYDLAVVSVDAPADGCGLSDEIVTVTIANYGAALVDTFQVAFNVDGIGTVIDTITDTLAAGTTMLYSFTATADLSTPNTSYLIAAWTILAEDTLNDNDTASIAVQHMNTIASFPYFENLELTDGNWISVGANSTWEYGIPAATVINDSATLNHAWVTNLTGDFTTSESSSLQGPCMDFSALTLPIIKLDVWYEIPTGLFGIGGGYARVQYSLDAGNTWDILLGGPNAANWYTGNGWTGSTGGWITASTSAPALAGASDVRLRVQFTGSSALAGTDEGIAVDNIKIYEAPPVDAGVAEILVPESGCGLGSETVVVSIVNYGTASISSGLAVEYIVNGGTPVAENITSTIVPGDTLIFAFATEADLSTPGGYSIEAYTTHAADTVNTNNDGTSITIFNTPVISAFPYDEDFETNNGYWSDQGASSSWDYGMPVGTLINYAFSGNNAWVTNLSGNHNSNETSYLLSPCFNFSSLVTPNLSMKIWYELPTLGNAIFEGSLDGGDSWFTIGSSNDPNWFTGASGWSGSSGDWTSVSHPLDTFAGQSHVRFRFYFNCSLAYLGSTEGLAVDNISISECVVPTASFTHSDSSLTVNFTNTSTDAVGYFWDFGDASISTQMSPTHTYAAGGTYEVCLVSSSDCASDTVCQSITVSVGIEENGMNHIAVFPNPATDKVLITLDKPIGGNSVIRIFNALGAVVLEQSVNSGELQFEINVSGLNAGVYTLNAGRVNTRLVVE